MACLTLEESPFGSVTLLTVSPRTPASYLLDPLRHDPVQFVDQGIAGRPPVLGAIQCSASPGHPEPLVWLECKVLVAYRVAPYVELMQPDLSPPIQPVLGNEICPQVHPQPTEVRAQRRRLRVPAVELSVPEKTRQHDLAGRVWRDCGHDLLHRFGVQVPAEPLEVRRQQNDVSVVDLLCHPSSAGGRAGYQLMGAFELIQFPELQ
jgi:hypothetical protein